MFKLIRTIEAFSEIKLDYDKPLYCDTETCHDEGRTDNSKSKTGGLYGQVRLFQFYQDGWEEAILVDCFFVKLDNVLNLIKGCTCIFFNASYDMHTINLYTDSVWIPRGLEDALYLCRIKYFTKTKFSFYDCLDYALLADEFIDSIDKKKEQKSDWSGPLSQKQKEYAAADVIYLAKLWEDVKTLTDSTVYQLDRANLVYAIGYSRNGMPVNRQKVTELKLEYMDKLEEVLSTLPVNPGSSPQCCEYLGTKSSSAEVLDELIIDGNKNAKKIKDARHYAKALTFLNRYDRPVIKGFFNPCAALSGRFSCTGGDSFDHANLQQIPDYCHQVIEAPEGYVIIYKDYSGLELRMGVSYTAESMMGSLMKAGEDMHTETAKFVFSTEEVTKQQRDIAKVFNFGLIYGGGVKMIRMKLKLQAGVTLSFQEVKHLIQKWFDMYEGFQEWHNVHKAFFNTYGYVDITTALGRNVRTYRLTDSLNFPIQGSSVEVQKVGLGFLFSRYPDVHLIDTIHDSNLLLAREDEAELWGNRLSECMVDAWHYVIEDLADPDIPMPHGFESGKVWRF